MYHVSSQTLRSWGPQKIGLVWALLPSSIEAFPFLPFPSSASFFVCGVMWCVCVLSLFLSMSVHPPTLLLSLSLSLSLYNALHWVEIVDKKRKIIVLLLFTLKGVTERSIKSAQTMGPVLNQGSGVTNIQHCVIASVWILQNTGLWPSYPITSW